MGDEPFCPSCPWADFSHTVQVSYGRCRILPPVTISRSEPGSKIWSGWPIVNDGDWCAEHPKRKPVEA